MTAPLIQRPVVCGAGCAHSPIAPHRPRWIAKASKGRIAGSAEPPIGMREDAMNTGRHDDLDPRDGTPESSEAGRPSAAVRWIDTTKRHPLVVSAVALVAFATFMTTAWALARDTAGLVEGLTNPHGDLYERIDQLRLDVTPESVDAVLGPPSSILNPEADCPRCDALSLRVYQLEDDITVRGLFEGSTLSLFLVTRVNPDVRPMIRWQGGARGALGDVSFAEASGLTGAGSISPTDVAYWPGAQRITYMEVFALGAPGNYEGLILGHSTEGASVTPFDLGDAQVVADAYTENVGEVPTAGVPFRRTSRPNVFGAFRDDGPLAELIRDAEFVNSIQTEGTTA